MTPSNWVSPWQAKSLRRAGTDCPVFCLFFSSLSRSSMLYDCLGSWSFHDVLGRRAFRLWASRVDCLQACLCLLFVSACAVRCWQRTRKYCISEIIVWLLARHVMFFGQKGTVRVFVHGLQRYFQKNVVKLLKREGSHSKMKLPFCQERRNWCICFLLCDEPSKDIGQLDRGIKNVLESCQRNGIVFFKEMVTVSEVLLQGVGLTNTAICTRNWGNIWRTMNLLWSSSSWRGESRWSLFYK